VTWLANCDRQRRSEEKPMSFWDTLWTAFRTSFRDQAPRYKTPILEPGQVDRGGDANPIAEGTSYLRLWLVEMCLAHGTDFFQKRYPVVYTETTYKYGGKAVTVPFIAGVDYFKRLTDRNLDKVVSKSFEITPVFPFATGTIGFKAGLFSMKASDPVGAFVETLGDFAKLLPVPELSAVVNVAEKINSGVQSLFNAGESRMELGYQQTFAPAGSNGANELRPGYFAVVLGAAKDFEDKDLRVVKDVLHLAPGGANPNPLSGYNYMLFRVEKRTTQDWETLTAIKELVERAQDALQKKEQAEAKEILAAIKITILRSPDVVKADRKAMYDKIEAELRDLGLEGKRADGAAVRSLNSIMQRPTARAAAADPAWGRLEELLEPERLAARAEVEAAR
jgi:hypothetical protein